MWTFETDGPVNVDAKVNAGRVDVATTDTGPVEINCDDPTRIDVSRSGQTIVIDQPRGLFSGRVRVTLRVPRGSNLDVSIGAADVTVEDGCAEVTVTGASGDVRVSSAQRVRVASASGDIRLGSITGDASISTASGDVLADAVEGDLEVSLASGDVRIHRVAGNASISTASGDVRIDRCDGSSVELKSISGDLVLGLPGGIRVDADLNSLNGRIELPDRDPSAPPAIRNVRVTAKTTTGDITIRRA